MNGGIHLSKCPISSENALCSWTIHTEFKKKKVSKRKEITKIRVKTNEIEKVNQHKGCTYEKVSKMEEKIAKFIKNKGEVSNK